MDQKLVDRLRRLAVVGMVSVLCGGSPVLAGSNPHGNPNCPGKSCEDHGNAKGHGRPNCPGKSCDSNGNPGGPIACTADADCPADRGCRNGLCHKDICTTDADCDAGDGCRNGKCHKDICTTDADCDADEGCRHGKCHKDVCTTDADCDALEQCRNGKCHKGGSDSPKSTDDGGLPTPTEICGDCIDNDGNGLTDLEDAACCSEAQEFAMTLSRGVIVPRGETSRVRLRSILMGDGMTHVTPTTQDVLLQIRPTNGPDIFCARIPASAFVQHHNIFKFTAKKTPTSTAKGLDGVMVKMKRDGTVRFRTLGKRVQLSPEQGQMELTLGFINNANPAATRCSSTTTSFQNVRQTTLIAR